MDPNLQTSFIPKKPIATSVKPPPRRFVGIIGLIATIVFSLSIVFAGGVFGYKKILEGQKEEKIASLERDKKALEIDTIQEYRRLDERFKVSEELIEKHLAPTEVFQILSEVTLKSIKFDSFSFGVGGGEDGFLKISLRGKARGYSSVALQADELGRLTELRQPVVSDLSLDERGNVTFTVNALLDQRAVLYRSIASSRETAKDVQSESGGSSSSPSANSTNTVNPTPTPASQSSSGSQSAGGGAGASGSSSSGSGSSGSAPPPQDQPVDDFEDFESL